MTKFYTAAVFSLVLMIGCGVKSESTIKMPDSEKGARSLAEKGYKILEANDKSFSMSVPEEWIHVAKDNPDMNAAIKRGLDASPGLEDQVEFWLSNDAIQMIAIEMRPEVVTKTGFAENLNVILMEGAPDPMPEEEWEKTAKATAEALGTGGAMKWEVLELPAGKAAHYYGTMKMGTMENDLAGYILVLGGNSYTITFSCAKGEMSKRKEHFDKMARSFALKG